MSLSQSPVWPAPGECSETNQAECLCRLLFHMVKKKKSLGLEVKERMLEKDLMYSGVQ